MGLYLCFEMRPGAQPWKWLLNVQEKVILIWKVMQQDSFWNNGKSNSDIAAKIPAALILTCVTNSTAQHCGQSQDTGNPTNQSILQVNAADAKRGKTCASDARLVLVSLLIAWKSGGSVFFFVVNQGCHLVMQNCQIRVDLNAFRCKHGLFITWKGTLNSQQVYQRFANIVFVPQVYRM